MNYRQVHRRYLKNIKKEYRKLIKRIDNEIKDFLKVSESITIYFDSKLGMGFSEETANRLYDYYFDKGFDVSKVKYKSPDKYILKIKWEDTYRCIDTTRGTLNE